MVSKELHPLALERLARYRRISHPEFVQGSPLWELAGATESLCLKMPGIVISLNKGHGTPISKACNIRYLGFIDLLCHSGDFVDFLGSISSTRSFQHVTFLTWYNCNVGMRGFAKLAQMLLRLTHLEVREDYEIRLSAKGLIRGRIIDPDEYPLPFHLQSLTLTSWEQTTLCGYAEWLLAASGESIRHLKLNIGSESSALSPILRALDVCGNSVREVCVRLLPMPTFTRILGKCPNVKELHLMLSMKTDRKLDLNAIITRYLQFIWPPIQCLHLEVFETGPLERHKARRFDPLALTIKQGHPETRDLNLVVIDWLAKEGTEEDFRTFFRKESRLISACSKYRHIELKLRFRGKWITLDELKSSLRLGDSRR